MKCLKYYFLIFIFLFFINQDAKALDLVFPQTLKYETWANTTYIMGSVKKGAELTINEEPVKVWNSGAFCHIVYQIPVGENVYVLKETYKYDNGEIVSNEKTLHIKKYSSSWQSTPQINIVKKPYSKKQPEIKPYEQLSFAYVVNDGSPVRNYPSTDADRISHLPLKTTLSIEGEYKDWYKIRTNDEPLWILKNSVKVLYPLDNELLVSVRNAEISQDNEFDYLKLNLDVPVPYKLEEVDGNVDLTIWGVKDIDELVKGFKKNKTNYYIKSYENNILTITIPTEKTLWGYGASYDNYTFIFRKRKCPVQNLNNPLKGLKVLVDAGHGGSELGTVGPTLIPEKDVNLAISEFLKKELEKKGATVIMTREDDSYVEIYSRVKKAVDEDASFSISVHSNSMVDGNPLERHGVSVFYYNEEAHEMADTIKSQMVQNLDFLDSGTNYASFVLTRATIPVSVLVEVGYMPNPDEYEKLINKKFQKKAAKAIAEGFEKYLKNKIKNIDIDENNVVLPANF